MGESNRILVKMLERLRAGLIDGPGLNCRPHRSRQRIDLTQFEKLSDVTGGNILRELLGAEKRATIQVKLAPRDATQVNGDSAADEPPPTASSPAGDESTTAPRRGPSRFRKQNPNDPLVQQQAVLQKLRLLIEDARVYEQDTGVHALNIGFPLLSLPPNNGRGNASSRRILAPIAFVPITLNVRTRPRHSIELACQADEIDRVVPNPSLFTWLDQFDKRAPESLFSDESGRHPWREVVELTRWIAEALEVELPSLLAGASMPDAGQLPLIAAPKAEDCNQPCILPVAVLGLFPMNNQALIRDMEAMVEGKSLDGPVRSFIDVSATLDAPPYEYAPADETLPAPSNASGESAELSAANERLVSLADPCQARAVRLARSTAGLVIHGPPGTGKSQTITNIVGDHLFRGERVLVVCEKRTALDVVADRLSHLNLGELVAVVHDPSRDQRELYRSVRQQLENLNDTRTNDRAERDIGRLDRELDSIRHELVEARELLHAAHGAEGLSFHETVGRWLSICPQEAAQEAYQRIAAEGAKIALADVDTHGRDLRDLLQKADAVQFGANPWSRCAGLTLDELLSRSAAEIREALRKCLAVAQEADTAAVPNIPVFRHDVSLADQSAVREQVADHVESLLAGADETVLGHWLRADAASRKVAWERLRQADAMVQVFRRGPLDAELWFTWGRSLPSPAELAGQVGALERYLGVAGKWYGFACLRSRRRADAVLSQFGLPPGREAADKLRQFLKGCQARRSLRHLLAALVGISDEITDQGLDDDRRLGLPLDTHLHALGALCAAEQDERLEPVRALLPAALADRQQAQQLCAGLRASRARATQIDRLDAELNATNLFRKSWLAQIHQQLCLGKRAAAALNQLLETLANCEPVLRILEALDRLPADLRRATSELLKRSVPADECLATVTKLAWEHAIRGQLAADARLQRLDGERLAHSIQRYRDLRAEKHALVCEAARHRWVETQKTRLLASTRSRLNSEGADVRRRLTMQGDRALRLRKVIEIGAAIEGGDPLFDLRPVWMASPETVAQILPRLPLFDVIVFDEASQCRLEEALPVLTRGRRVVVAGDTRQLPPTRFFEAAVATSDDEDAASEQDWFELQQREVEDLLAGALNLQIEQCYLDVHYRSRNADLISFSNMQFYASRLQAIPGHPRERVRFSPITLYAVRGVYEDRRNRIEAEEVCRIVRDLLRRAEPPSIGIACFNTDQRDLILECLDELANQDAEFAKQIAAARARKGSASSEGLFVKNLENVQGDERDHIIISTTYGPDPTGRFYRRFGPLGRAGGGRRLNVLVTRARHEVHLVSSIPAAVYRSLPPLQPGQTPNGAWLLFSYLNYAEQLAALYVEAAAALEERDQREARAPASELAAAVDVGPSSAPSMFAEALAQHLARAHRQRGTVHWGNDGFCVDVALGHPRFVEDVTVGLLCDMNRYARADDPIEWEIFRTDVLEATGWELKRVWSPQFFRDPLGVSQAICRSADELLSHEEEKNAIRVSPR